MLRVVIYRHTKSQLFLQTLCAVVFAINERLKCNALKGCMEVMHVIVAMFPSKRNHTSITFKVSINLRG